MRCGSFIVIISTSSTLVLSAQTVGKATCKTEIERQAVRKVVRKQSACDISIKLREKTNELLSNHDCQSLHVRHQDSFHMTTSRSYCQCPYAHQPMTGLLGPRDPMSRIAQRTKERPCEPSWASIFMPSAWRSWRPIHSRKGSCRKAPRSISAEAFRRTLARLHPRHPTVCIKSHAAGNIRPRVYRDPLSLQYTSAATSLRSSSLGQLKRQKASERRHAF